MNAIIPVGQAIPAARKRRSVPSLPAWMEGTTREELIGLSRDGRKLLWSTGQVRPSTTFPCVSSGEIASAKYVLDWKGHRITAHCSQAYEGNVEVQIMCGGGISVLPVREAVRIPARGRCGRSRRACSAPGADAENNRAAGSHERHTEPAARQHLR